MTVCYIIIMPLFLNKGSVIAILYSNKRAVKCFAANQQYLFYVLLGQMFFVVTDACLSDAF